ncbi:hypothetical protein PENPOL_c012G05031 [Penicillium polonicum]|nr:hypothetical protein PENPOL_c012G05031 [Penicillium polonicum]
MSFFNF